jgi:hypothetical protein
LEGEDRYCTSKQGIKPDQWRNGGLFRNGAGQLDIPVAKQKKPARNKKFFLRFRLK